MKKFYFVGVFLLSLVLFSCSRDADEYSDNSGSVTISQIPTTVNNKKMILKRNGTTYLSVTHFSDGATVNNQTVDYAKNPPKYTYTTLSSRSAKYHLEVMRKTYIPLYETYTYNKFVFDYTLYFSYGSNSSGTFVGTETNSQGVATKKDGTFTIE